MNEYTVLIPAEETLQDEKTRQSFSHQGSFFVDWTAAFLALNAGKTALENCGKQQINYEIEDRSDGNERAG